MKNKLAKATLQLINKAVPFSVKTDQSNFTIASTLNQIEKPVAFYARTFFTKEQRHSEVEKEAYTVAEAFRKWKHLLLGKYFTLITDQRRVLFMLNKRLPLKIKNDKILRSRLKLATLDFTMLY